MFVLNGLQVGLALNIPQVEFCGGGNNNATNLGRDCLGLCQSPVILDPATESLKLKRGG